MNSSSLDQTAENAPTPAIARPGILYVAGPPGADVQPLTQILEQAGLSQKSTESGQLSLQWQMLANSDPQSIAGQLQASADAHLLLFYRAATPVLAEAMGQGRSPDDSLKEWLAQAEAILGMIRQNRRRVSLVEMTLAQQDPVAFIERLGQRLSLTLKTPISESARNAADQDAIYRLIAHAAVMNNMKARRAAAELQATALPVGMEETLLPEALNAWQAYQRKDEVELEKAQAEPEQYGDLEELKEENELLLLQLHQVQEELESYYLEGRDLGSNYQQLEARNSKLEKEHRVLKQRAEVLQQKIDNMRKSSSWRLTKPLRGFNKMFKRSRNKQG
jgi:hypothetical protein